jgi:transcriptional regulator with XRE-family HTH domain
MDAVRRRIQALVKREGLTLAEVSRSIGRNHAYLQQFMRRGTPKTLPEDVRHALADFFDVDEAELRLAAAAKIGTTPARAGGNTADRPIPKSLAARLSVARAESVFETPSAFAEAAGIPRHRYADLEDGEDSPSLDELDRISRCSGKSLEYFIRGEMSQPTPSGPADSPLSEGDAVLDPPRTAAGRRKRRDFQSR